MLEADQQMRITSLQKVIVEAISETGERNLEIQMAALLRCLATRSEWSLKADRIAQRWEENRQLAEAETDGEIH